MTEQVEELAKCWSCNMPQPPDYRLSLHLEDCPEHDEETCMVCLDESEDHTSEWIK